MIAIRMAFRSVLRNWRHSLATTISVALGLVSVALIDGFIKDVQRQAADFIIKRSMYGHFIIEKAGLETHDMWQGLLSKEQAELIGWKLQHFGHKIEAYTRFLPIQGMVQGAGNSLGFFGYAYDIKNGEKARGSQWRWNTL